MEYQDQYNQYAALAQLATAEEKLKWLDEQVASGDFVDGYARAIYDDQIKGENVRSLTVKIVDGA